MSRPETSAATTATRVGQPRDIMPTARTAAGYTGDRADREVDLTQQQDQDDPERQGSRSRRSCGVRFTRLRGERKLLLRVCWKTIQMTTRPTTTGSEPRSPLLKPGRRGRDRLLMPWLAVGKLVLQVGRHRALLGGAGSRAGWCSCRVLRRGLPSGPLRYIVNWSRR